MKTLLALFLLSLPLPFMVQGQTLGPVRTVDTTDAWAFAPGDDRFTPDAALDLRSLLNESVAGEHGFVRLSEDRSGFVRGDGKDLRFWAVVSDGFDLSPADMERHAAWLAKRGVNMVRIHAQLCDRSAGASITSVNTKRLDAILRWVAACKRHGIYLTISPYWAHGEAPESWGIEGYAGSSTWGLLFFNPRLQEGYRAWLKALYTTPNPYAGGVPLRDEPAVAIAQLQNEDSLLFWTFDAMKPAQRRLLGTLFHAWACHRHGSIEKTMALWQNSSAEGDDLKAGILGFHKLWEYTAAAPPKEGGMAYRMGEPPRWSSI